jgi:hypothetical protein
MTQQTLDFTTPPMVNQPRFAGVDYDHERDSHRLTGQLERVYSVMRDRQWHTLESISQVTRDPQASISAQLRHLRKARFGGYVVERRHVGGGLYEYRML